MLDKSKVLVMGIGVSGINITNYLINQKILPDVRYCVLDSDKQVFNFSKAEILIQAGVKQTGGDSKKGRKAVEENIEELEEVLKDIKTLFILTCVGGGISTGGTLAVVDKAKEMGILTYCIVAKPFKLEDKKVLEVAELTIKVLKEKADVVIAIPNDDALTFDNKSKNQRTAIESFITNIPLVIKSIYDFMFTSGFVDVNHQDIENLFKNTNECHINIGKSSGENRANKAIRNVVESNEYKDILQNAKSVMISVSGSDGLKLNEFKDVVETLAEYINNDTQVVCGCVIDEKLQDEVQVTVIAG